MISEKEFVSNYTFYWNKVFPFSSRLIRKINLQKVYFTESLKSVNPSENRAIVNELAFRLFATSVDLKKKLDEFVEAEIRIIMNDVIQYIANFDKNSSPNTFILSISELQEAISLAKNLIEYFGYNNLEISPSFKGCSIINNCYGDLKTSNCIYEVKAGDRDFRGNDIRQLLVYALLSYASNNSYENIGLINPRKGCAIEINLKEAIEISSGRSVDEVFSDMLEFIDTSETF